MEKHGSYKFLLIFAIAIIGATSTAEAGCPEWLKQIGVKVFSALRPLQKERPKAETTWDQFVKATGANSSPILAENASSYWPVGEKEMKGIIRGDRRFDLPPDSRHNAEPGTWFDFDETFPNTFAHSDRDKGILSNAMRLIKNRKPDELVIIFTGHFHSLDLYFGLSDSERRNVAFVSDPKQKDSQAWSPEMQKFWKRFKIPEPFDTTHFRWQDHHGVNQLAARVAQLYYYHHLSGLKPDLMQLLNGDSPEPGVIAYQDTHGLNSNLVAQALPDTATLRRLGFTRITFAIEGFTANHEYTLDDVDDYTHFGRKLKRQNLPVFEDISKDWKGRRLLASPALSHVPTFKYFTDRMREYSATLPVTVEGLEPIHREGQIEGRRPQAGDKSQ